MSRYRTFRLNRFFLHSSGALLHLPILNLQLPGIEGAAKTTAASIFYRQIIIVVIVYIGIPVFQRRTDSGFCSYSGVPVSIHWRRSYRLASRGICAILVQIFVCTLNVFPLRSLRGRCRLRQMRCNYIRAVGATLLCSEELTAVNPSAAKLPAPLDRGANGCGKKLSIALALREALTVLSAVSNRATRDNRIGRCPNALLKTKKARSCFRTPLTRQMPIAEASASAKTQISSFIKLNT